MAMPLLAQKHVATVASDTIRVVIYCAGPSDHSALQFLARLPPHPALQVHVVSPSDYGQHLSVRVLSPLHAMQKKWPSKESKLAQALMGECGAGDVADRLANYCTEIAASLVIASASPTGTFRDWWSAPLAHRLACRIPVLSIPAGCESRILAKTERPIRWLVPLDGSPAAENILGHLHALSHWLPSELTLVRPLE